MKYFLCFIFLLLSFFVGKAQFNVRFTLGKEYPLKHVDDSIFIAGDFNNWDPHNINFVLPQKEEKPTSLLVKLAAGHYEYKITRGNWYKAEGLDREFTISGDTTIEINVYAWYDNFPDTEEKKHTASAQVHIFDSAFFITQLKRPRRIWIYLPKEYEQSKKQYPVMYMQGGQNLFDAATSEFGEWGVDEILDSLISAGKTPCIVVGIDDGTIFEYSPYEIGREKAEGNEYVDFLVNTLKPIIDKRYRTLRDKENTIIGGHAMGAFIAYYAMIKQPQVFGKAGIFSPALIAVPQIKSLTDSLSQKVSGKFFFYTEDKSGESYLKDMLDLQESLGEKSSAQIYSVIDEDGTHNEAAWRKWFAEFYCFIMADGFNNVVKVEE